VCPLGTWSFHVRLGENHVGAGAVGLGSFWTGPQGFRWVASPGPVLDVDPL